MEKVERYQRIIKDQKGITLISLVVTIVILLILASVTISILFSENGIIKKAQEAKDIWKNAAESEANAIEELGNKLNNKVEKIPISTAEQLLKIGSGEEVIINEKSYIFEKGKVYSLQNDIEYTGDYDTVAELIKNNEITFDGEGHKIVVINDSDVKEYYTEDSKYYIATNKYGYVLDGLQLYYDGIDNTGTGTHSNIATTWKDLSGNNRDGILSNFGTSAISGWNNEYLSFDGVNDWVNCGELNSENVTLEAVHRLKSGTDVDRAILGNWDGGGNGIFTRYGTLGGNLYSNSQYYFLESDINTNNIKNKIITQSLTFEGKSENIYMNGQQIATQVVNGNIEPPQNSTVMAIGANPKGNTIDASFADIDVYAIRIYNRGLSKEEIEVNNKTDNKRFKNPEKIPIYTAEQLINIGTGEQVTVEQEKKTYTYLAGAKYELKNDIIISDDYTSIINKINNKEIELISNEYKIINNGNYYTSNSKYTIAVNKYGYVINGLQLLLDVKDNTGTGEFNKTATIWKDLSGNNRDGVLQKMDMTNCWDEDGLRFDGIDDYVLIEEMNYENITLETVCTKGTENGTTTSKHIISNVDSGGYVIYQGTNNRFFLGAYIKENEEYANTIGTGQLTTYEPNIKYSLSGSYNGKIMKMRTSNGNSAPRSTSYIETVVEGSIGKPLNNTNMILGANPKGTQGNDGSLYNGLISSVRIYNRALTDEENAVNYLNDRDRYGV